MEDIYKEDRTDIFATVKLLTHDMGVGRQEEISRYLSDTTVKLKNWMFMKFISRIAGRQPEYHIPVLDRISQIREHFGENSRYPESGSQVKFLVRIDDFPRWDITLDKYKVFHEVLSKKNIPYLLGVTPFKSKFPKSQETVEDLKELSEEEVDVLKQILDDNVEIGMHGFSHKTISKKDKTELVGLSSLECHNKIRESLDLIRNYGFDPKVFIPTFNSIDYRAYGCIKEYFDIICGGPETVPLLGFRITPSILMGRLYIASYPPVYGRAAYILKQIRRIRDINDNIIIPITLHWAWEVEDDYKGVDYLMDEIKENIIPWDSILQE